MRSVFYISFLSFYQLYSKLNPMSSKTSRRIYNTKICDNNFDQYSPSEVTEYFDYDVYASATILLAHMTKSEVINSNSYLPPEYYNLLIPEAKEL